MKISLIALAAFAGTIGASASAQTYDAFTSFTGAPQPSGNGNFIYGEADPANPGSSGTLFTANTNCFIAGSTCLQRAPNFDVPGVTKSTVASFQYGSVNVPTDRLLAHPGNDTLQTFVAFVAPTAGIYTYKATFNIQDVRPTGVGINLIRTTSGGLPLIFTPLSVINGQVPSYSTMGQFTLGASEAFGFGIDNQGNFSNDSTGINFTVFAGVPEPTTWGLLILGFGVIGGSMRRRTKLTAIGLPAAA